MPHQLPLYLHYKLVLQGNRTHFLSLIHYNCDRQSPECSYKLPLKGLSHPAHSLFYVFTH